MQSQDLTRSTAPTLSTSMGRPLAHDIFSLRYLKIRKLEDNMKVHGYMLKALITGHVPIWFIHNKSLVEARQKLSVPRFTTASQHVLVDRVLPRLHAHYSISAKAWLKQNTNTSISLDGWTECFRNSVYPVLILRGTQIKKMIDVLDLEAVWHTSDIILAALKTALHGEVCYPWANRFYRHRFTQFNGKVASRCFYQINIVFFFPFAPFLCFSGWFYVRSFFFVAHFFHRDLLEKRTPLSSH